MVDLPAFGLATNKEQPPAESMSSTSQVRPSWFIESNSPIDIQAKPEGFEFCSRL